MLLKNSSTTIFQVIECDCLLQSKDHTELHCLMVSRGNYTYADGANQYISLQLKLLKTRHIIAHELGKAPYV